MQPEVKKVVLPGPVEPLRKLDVPKSVGEADHPLSPLRDVVKPRETVTDGEGSSGGRGDEEGLPMLEIDWEGPEELLMVARALGMRLRPVDRDDHAIGEVSLEGEPRLVEPVHEVSAFSNRIRQLPRPFLAQVLPGGLPDSIAAFHILVPSRLDEQFVQLQKQAIKERGMSNSEVQLVRAAFVAGDTGYRLVVTEVVRKGDSI